MPDDQKPDEACLHCVATLRATGLLYRDMAVEYSDLVEVALGIDRTCRVTQMRASIEELLSKLADKNCVSVDELCEDTGYGKRARAALGGDR